MARKPGQTRIDLAQNNVNIIKDVMPQIAKFAPDAVYVVVSNPVDILRYAIIKATGLPEHRVIGSGTLLDSARLRSALAEHVHLSPESVQAYVFGEHGDSSMIPWSLTTIAGMEMDNYCTNVCPRHNQCGKIELHDIEDDVRTAGAKVIKLKGATYYAIALSVKRICECVLRDTDTVLSVSGMLHDNYGMSELIGPGVSGECEYRDGLHINEDHFFAEVVDPETLAEKSEGEVGELVITTMTKEALPLLRYRTRDLSRITYAPCKCGRTTARMDKIMGRSDDMLKIKGVNVFPSQIESVLMPMEQVSPHYMLYVRHEGYTDTLEVKVELIDASLLERYSDLEHLTDMIHSRLRTVLGIDAKVTLVQPKTIERFSGKAKRVVDLR